MTESCYEIMRSARDVNVTVMMGGCVGPAKLPKSTLLEQCAGRVANVTDMMADITDMTDMMHMMDVTDMTDIVTLV